MSNAALQMRGPVGGTTDAKKVAVGSSVGAVIETYDFIGFGTAAALYFGTAFFPSENPVTGTLAAFATLGVGFAARPIGGILGGHLGDRVGRKPVLVGSLIVMGLATFAIGLLPTYATVGVLAPVLLVLVRIIQGLAFGAEWGGAILMAYEHAPWRPKGRHTGIVQAGFPVGLLLANLVFLFSVHLGDSLAWRVPFLASIVLVAVGLIIRSKVPESPVFEEVKEAGTIAKSPIMDSIRYDWKNILRGIGLRIAETAGYAVSITYMISYLNTNDLTTRIQTLTALCIAAALGIGATLGWAALTDKIGRRPIYLAVTAFGILWGVGMFALANTGIVILIGLAIVISYTVSQNALAGCQGAWFPELFTAARRASGASLAYQISAMVSGFTPFITTLLYLKFGWVGPALLFSTYALIGLIAALLTRETFGRRGAGVRRRRHRRPGPRLGRPPAARLGPDHRQGEPPVSTDVTTPQDATDVDEQTARTDEVRRFAYRMRHDVLNMGEEQGQGYVGQALGAADMLAAIYANRLRYRADDPHWDGRDRFLLSTGHYAIGLYAALAEAGIVPLAELATYGSDDSRLPMSGMATYTPGMEISGGSLGHGLPIAVGLALGLRYRGSGSRVYNFLSDGELNEGSTWEAAMGAVHHQLGNLTALVDINALQADGPTAGVLSIEPIHDKWAAFGWHVQRVNGNDVDAVVAALDAADAAAAPHGQPSVVLCDTKVGSGVPLLENREKAHFMRIDEHEWQICREQLTLGAPEGSNR